MCNSIQHIHLYNLNLRKEALRKDTFSKMSHKFPNPNISLISTSLNHKVNWSRVRFPNDVAGIYSLTLITKG